jgi:hypothetical protein
MNVWLDYGPETVEEKVLKEQLLELQRAYHKEAEPILNRLTAIHMLKTPRMHIMPDVHQGRPS